MIRTRRPADHRSRARRWQDAVAQLCELQAQYADWLEALPANQHDTAGWWHKAADQGDALAQDALGSMYPDAIEFMLRDIESRHAEIILVLCFIAPLIFVLVLIALSRGRRLRKRVDELTHSVRELINEQEPRYTRVLLGRAKDKDPG